MKQIRNDKLLKLIALRIKELRSGKDISQEDFYLDTNIHIARIETAKINLSISTLNAICEYFDISLKDFFNDL